MPSVPSIDRQKASTVFRSVEHSHLRDVLPVVEDRLSEALDGEETLPDVPLLATLLGRVQVEGTQRLIAGDKAHEEELANDSEPRQRRDESGERVHKKLVEVRRIAVGLFGPERSAELLGAPGLTAPVTEGERLWRQAEDTAKRLCRAGISPWPWFGERFAGSPSARVGPGRERTGCRRPSRRCRISFSLLRCQPPPGR